MTEAMLPFRKLARDVNVDAVMLVPGPNFERLLGRTFASAERPTLIAVPADGAPAAIVPNLELAAFQDTGFEGEIFDWRDQDGYAAAFDAMADALPAETIAVEGQVMRVFVHHALIAAYPGARIVDAERQISGLRIRKTAGEIAAIEEAIGISETALGEVLDAVRPGQTEKEVERHLLTALYSAGADGLAFGPLVSAAAQSAMPHAEARDDYALCPGDALLIDFGARRRGLCADITRTVFVGHATDEAADVYDTVLRANAEGHRITAPGVTAHQVDDAVIGTLEASPYADRIRTKTGHGLGRDVHEAPYIVRGNPQVLEPGMVFTNEPGLYRLGHFGVRIEDDILVTETGCRSLSTFPRDLTVVGRC